MPPKKLSKKEMDELKKAEALKKEEDQRKHREEAEKKELEQQRLRKIEEEKRLEEQRRRLEEEQHEFGPRDKQLKGKEQVALKELYERHNWKKYVQADELPNVEGADLSTYISQYEESRQQTNEEIMVACQQSELIARSLEDQCMNYLSEKQPSKLVDGLKNIKEIRRITMIKLENILVGLSAIADTFLEQKQAELTKKIGESKKHDEKGQEDIMVFRQEAFRLAVFFNSSSSKNPYRFRPVEIKDFGFKSQIPGKLVSSNLILKFEWTDFDPYCFTQHLPFYLVGGVLTIEFFDVLSNARKMPNWTLKTEYQGREVLEKSRITNIGQKEMFTVAYQLPEYVYLRAIDKTSIKIAGWDGTKWSILPANEPVKVDSTTKSFEFQVGRPGSVAYVQDRCTDFPYASWEMRSVKKDTVLLDLKGKRETFRIEISPNAARLVTKEPELQRLTKDGFTPEKLLNEMKKIGINLLPTDEDYEAAGVEPKNMQAEERGVKDLAQSVISYFIRSHPIPSNRVVAKLRENLEYDEVFLEDQQKDWKRVQWWPNKCGLVESKHVEETHYNIEMLLKNTPSADAECRKRMETDEQFVLKNTVMRVIRLTRMLAFVSDRK